MLLTLEQVKSEIEKGKNLLLAGDENLLSQLPEGNWIGGTIPYFMAADGGKITKEEIFSTTLPDDFSLSSIQLYDEKNISNVAQDAPENGCSFIIIPAGCTVHLDYAQEAPNYPEMFMKPIVGWISGIHLADEGATPRVFDGKQGKMSGDQAVVMHTELPAGTIAQIGIINLFTEGGGDTISFKETGFSAKECLINGEEKNFADYLLENDISTVNPLVADYFGAKVNVSFKAINEAEKTVDFYAPVFTGVEYKTARPVKDYVSEFQAELAKVKEDVTFSCNCILNFLYSELEGKKTGSIVGPITFGEIAYQLLNQTMVYLVLQK